MNTATLSTKFQIPVPKAVRESLGLVPGQKSAFIQTGSSIRLAPQPAVAPPGGPGARREHRRLARPRRPAAAVHTRDQTQTANQVKLPDTCVWVEVLADTPPDRRHRALFDRSQNLIVPTLVQYELRRWALRELDDDAADRTIAATRNANVVMRDEPTALHAAALAQEFKLASADALICASALRHRATLVSCDSHVDNVPGVQYRAKATARA